MKSPPQGVKLVMEAVCILKDIKPDKLPNPSGIGTIEDYWGPSKRLLGDMKFLEGLIKFEKDTIPEKIMEKIRTKILVDPLFVPDVIAKASNAAKGICEWVIALSQYDVVAKIVAPKKEALAAAEAELQIATEALEEKRGMLRAARIKVANLNKMLEDEQAKLKRLSDESDLCAKKLQRAADLIGGLGGERVRWRATAEALGEKYDSLCGNILISAGIVAYLGPFTMDFRNDQIKKWTEQLNGLGIPCDENFQLVTVLGEPVEIRQWNLFGLPSDNFSVENAIIIKYVEKCNYN